MKSLSDHTSQQHKTVKRGTWVAVLCLALAGVLCLGVVPAALAEPAMEEFDAAPIDESFELVGSAEELDVDTSALAESDELVEAYIEEQFATALPDGAEEADRSASTTSTTTTLTGRKLEYLNYLKGYVSKIATGEEISTVIDVPGSIAYDKNSFTLSEAKALDSNVTALDQTAANAIMQYLDSQDVTAVVLDALLADCPQELYWFDKIHGFRFETNPYTEKYDGQWHITVDFRIVLYVSQDYSNGTTYLYEDYNGSIVDTGILCEVDSTTGTTIAGAVAKAQAIAAANPDASARVRLQGFKEAICDLASYNHVAANGGAVYGNPWQLVWVFDEDESTTVVCEGYSKAFQYLCELANIPGVTCRSVTGFMGTANKVNGADFSMDDVVISSGGGHMWNVVNMDDGRNYLVDVTNCDAGSDGHSNSVGHPDNLFMKLHTCGSVREGYAFELENGQIPWYKYDDGTPRDGAVTSDMFDIFSEADLTLSEDAYDGPAVVEYTVTLAPGTGTGDAIEQSVVAGESFELPWCTEFSKTSYSFYGWAVDGDIKHPGDTFVVESDVTVTALWKRDAASIVDNAVDNSTMTVRGNLTVTDTRVGVTYTKTDYDFGTAASNKESPMTEAVEGLITQAEATLQADAVEHAEGFDLTGEPSTSAPTATSTWDNRTSETTTKCDDNGDYYDETVITGTYSCAWECTVSLDAQYTTPETVALELGVTDGGSVVVATGEGEDAQTWSLSAGSSQELAIPYAQSVTLTATASTAHQFVGWYEGTKSNDVVDGHTGEPLSTDVEYTYTATSDTILRAVFVSVTIDGATFSSIPAQSYCAAAIEPKPALTLRGVTLTEGEDYELSYKDNVNAGTATITATGKGNYTGSVSSTFRIVPASIDTAIIAEIENQTYSGSPIVPSLTVTLNGIELDGDTDYTVYYEDNTDVSNTGATVTVTGKGNYKDSVSTTFAIAPASIEDALIEIESQTYDGDQKTPVPTIVFGGMTLVAGKDYEVTGHANNTKAGKNATISIEGKGNFTGSTTASFEIAKARQSITLTSATAVSVAMGKTVSVRATASAGGSISYRSSNTNVATVYASGVVIPKNVGECTITITAGTTDNYAEATRTVKVVVIKGAQSISAPSSKDCMVGKTVSLGAKRTAGNGALTYTSSSKSIATVSSTGVVKGLKAGQVTITITAKETGNYKKATKTVKIKVGKTNPITAKAKKGTVAASLKTLKSKALTLASNITVKKAQGKVTYTNASTNATAKKFKVASGSGKITVPKGTKKGKYQVIITVKAAGNTSYLSATKTVKFYIQVK